MKQLYQLPWRENNPESVYEEEKRKFLSKEDIEDIPR